jgi:hypothetical protein
MSVVANSAMRKTVLQKRFLGKPVQ